MNSAVRNSARNVVSLPADADAVSMIDPKSMMLEVTLETGGGGTPALGRR